MEKIKVGIVGSTGYAGAELVRILLGHPGVEIKWFGSRQYADQPYADTYRNFFKLVDEKCMEDNFDKLADEVDVVFTATPQGYLAGVISEDILRKVKIIDLSADFRLKDVAVYEKWYKIEHKSPELIKEAVYGLCEINRADIPGHRLVANPGCYTTCSILSLYPLVEAGLVKEEGIIIDAKSGTSGAGRGAKVDNLFCEVNESMHAYGVAAHRHTPEIEEQLGYAISKDHAALTLQFTPHLIPINRGILVTAYAKLADPSVTEEQLREVYKKRYADEKFIRLLPEGKLPDTRWVEGSNYVDINIKKDERTGNVVVMGALDNLVKGAAGQAVQNMNLICGFPEDMGLTMVPMFP